MGSPVLTEPNAAGSTIPAKAEGGAPQTDAGTFVQSSQDNLSFGQGGLATDLTIGSVILEGSALRRAPEQAESGAERQVHAPQRLLGMYEPFLMTTMIVFVLGSALAYALPGLPLGQPTIGLSLIAVLLGLVVFACFKSDGRWRIRLALWLMALVAGALYYQQFHFRPAAQDVGQFAPLDRVEIQGRVLGANSPGKVVLAVTQVNGQKAVGQLLVSLPPDMRPNMQDIEAGTRVLIAGDLKKPFHTVIPGAFNQAAYLANQHITALLKAPERLITFETSNQPGFVLQRVTDQLKTQVAASFSRALPSPQAEILGGIVLGDKAIPVDRETRQSFIRTGLVHILAASGMNVSIIAGAILGLLAFCKLSYRWRLGLAMAGVAFYSLLTGLPPSIQRAATMLELALLLKMLDRQLSPLFLLCVSSAFLVLLNPDNIGSIGFQFSVLTTFGLLAMVPPLQEKLGYYITRWLAALLLVPLVAQLWIWPLSVYYFNAFPLHALPMNILAVALVAPLTVIGFAAGLVSLFLPPVAEWMTWLASPLLDGLLLLVHWGESLEGAQWQLASPPGWVILLCYGQLGLLLALIHRCKSWPVTRRILLALVPMLVILGGLSLQKAQARQQAFVDLLPLSWKHQAYLVKPPASEHWLAVLPTGLSYFEGRAFADYLRHRHINRLSGALLLPDNSTPPASPSRDGKAGGLKAAFKDTTVDSLIIPTDHPAEALPIRAGRIARFPKEGARLADEHLLLEGRLPRLRMISGNACLVQIDAVYRADSGCAVQAVWKPEGPRLFSAVDLRDNQFYRMIQTGRTLQFHGEPTR